MNIAKLIDHTLLRPDATQDDILTICREAREYGFASVCVNSCWVRLVKDALAGSEVKVCSVVGFPLGAASSAAKLAETQIALDDGALEIDMVQNIGALRSGDGIGVEAEIRSMAEMAHSKGALLKVILENSFLTDEQKIEVCAIAQRAGADFVKTSTGFGPSGATEHDVALMRRAVGTHMGVKASGGIRTAEDARKMVEAGANRIGASASVKIVLGMVETSGTSSGY